MSAPLPLLGASEPLAACLAAGGVAVIPTDTVYGLCCDPLDATAVDRLYELKGRPPRKPAALLFTALALALESLPELGPRTRKSGAPRAAGIGDAARSGTRGGASRLPGASCSACA